MILELKDELINPVGYFGGFPWIENEDNWPICPQTGENMLHLMTILPSIMGDSFSEDNCVSIFISFDVDVNKSPKKTLSDNYTFHESKDIDKLKSGFSKVIMTKKADKPLNSGKAKFVLPFKNIEKRPYTDKEYEEEKTLVEEANMGIDKSKFMGIPFFEQDIIDPSMRYFFLLQLNEWDIDVFAEEYKGIFQGGLGYVYLDRNIKKIQIGKDAGFFFIQHT
jgi:hypothetical protein